MLKLDYARMRRMRAQVIASSLGRVCHRLIDKASGLQAPTVLGAGHETPLRRHHYGEACARSEDR